MADRKRRYMRGNRPPIGAKNSGTDSGLDGLRRRSRTNSNSQDTDTPLHDHSDDASSTYSGSNTRSGTMSHNLQSKLLKGLCVCSICLFFIILILTTLVLLLIAESWFGAQLPFSKYSSKYNPSWREEPTNATTAVADTTNDNNNNIDDSDLTIPTCSGCACTKNNNNNIIFEDNFNFFNLRKWKHELTLSGGGNWEFQAYTNNRTNSFVKDGKLHIKPTYTNDLNPAKNDWIRLNEAELEIWGGAINDLCTSNQWWGCKRQTQGNNLLNPIQSARLRTAEHFRFRYGTVEIKAKLPKGDWLWPAFWLLPYDNYYGTWPSSGEIDIIEARGNPDLTCPEDYMDGTQIGINQFVSTLHYGPNWQTNGYPLAHTHYNLPNDKTFNDEFHIWKIEWKPSGFKYYLDNTKYWEVDTTTKTFWERGEFDNIYQNPWINSSVNAPFDREFFLIINLAVGGTGGNGGFFPDVCTSNGVNKPWLETSTQAPLDFWNAKNQWENTWDFDGSNSEFIIDYVKVTQP